MPTPPSIDRTGPLELLLVAGEASADLHAAALLRELKIICPYVHCYGVGGPDLAASGMEIMVPAENLGVVGVSDWFNKAGKVIQAYFDLRRSIRTRRPDAAVLIDLPDFNLLIARHLKAQGVPVFYYIPPQVWAWRGYRVKKIRRYFDQVLVLFPFEKTFFESKGVPVTWVGHPLLETLSPRENYRAQNEIASNPRIALLPGSRDSEVRFHVPILDSLVSSLESKYPNAVFRVPVAKTLNLSGVREAFSRRDRIEFIPGDSVAILKWADVGVVASGTATLEAALAGLPFCLFYKVSASSAWLFQRFVRYQGAIGMPNVLAGREVVREFFQAKATPEALFSECTRLIADPLYRNSMVQDLSVCRRNLGDVGASRKAALRISGLLNARRRMPHDLNTAPTLS
jgi:lipid-A-disaccharide synthase